MRGLPWSSSLFFFVHSGNWEGRINLPKWQRASGGCSGWVGITWLIGSWWLAPIVITFRFDGISDGVTIGYGRGSIFTIGFILLRISISRHRWFNFFNFNFRIGHLLSDARSSWSVISTCAQFNTLGRCNHRLINVGIHFNLSIGCTWGTLWLIRWQSNFTLGVSFMYHWRMVVVVMVAMTWCYINKVVVVWKFNRNHLLIQPNNIGIIRIVSTSVLMHLGFGNSPGQNKSYKWWEGKESRTTKKATRE